MDYATFEELLLKITPIVRREDTNMRLAISPKEKLSITLSFLAEGNNIINDFRYRTRVNSYIYSNQLQRCKYSKIKVFLA
jgi:hypothetical protein